MVNLILDVVGSIAALVCGIIGSLIATVLWVIAVGQPVVLSAQMRNVLHEHGLHLALVATAFYALTLASKVIQRRRADASPFANPGGQSSAVAKVRGGGQAGTAQRDVHINSHNVTGSYNTTVNGGVADELRTKRNRPDEFTGVIKAVADYANAGDRYWRRDFDSSGRYSLTPLTPEAHEKCPLGFEVHTVTQRGQPTMQDMLVQAATDQQPVTLDKELLTRARGFLGSETLHDSAEEPDADITLTVQVRPLVPPTRSTLRIHGTGISISSLNLGLFALPNGRLRLTNRHDQVAPIWVWIDFDQPQDPRGNDVPDTIEADHPAIALELRAVPGRTARHILALHDFLAALAVPRCVEIVDETTSNVLHVFEGTLQEDLTPEAERLVEDLAVVQDAFPLATFDLSTAPTTNDARTLARVASIVRDGGFDISIDEMTVTLAAASANTVVSWANDDGVVHVPTSETGYNDHLVFPIDDDDIAKLFGEVFHLGPSRMALCPVRILGNMAQIRAQAAALASHESLTLRLTPANANDTTVSRAYERYVKTLPSVAS